MRFWFRVFSPHRSLWPSYAPAQKRKLIRDHASTVFEDTCRERFPGAMRYWEGDLELDLVAPDPERPGGLLVAEVKWKRLTPSQIRSTLQQLEATWLRCSLRARHPRVRFAVLDASILSR